MILVRMMALIMSLELILASTILRITDLVILALGFGTRITLRLETTYPTATKGESSVGAAITACGSPITIAPEVGMLVGIVMAGMTYGLDWSTCT